ncbi:MAG: hypothetical protein IKD99_00360 [Erysipelotrichaceae bacterium]|nr:hypothetical protein [Erysipelotrichaceae bacterium]
MKKIKDLFERFLFTVEEVEEVVDDEPKPILEEVPAEKPQPAVRKTPVIEKPVVKKTNRPEPKQEEYEPSPMITLTKEIKVPKLGDEKTRELDKVEENQPVSEPVQENKTEKKEKKIEPELPKLKPAKPERKQAEPFKTTTIISPMLGVQEKEQKPVKKKRREIVMPDSEMGDRKSVIGTVFSPLYGDKNESDRIPVDEVDPSIATLTVDDLIAKEPAVENKPEVKAPVTEENVKVAEPEVLPLEEEIKDMEIVDLEPVKMTADELRKNAAVTPFGKVTRKYEEKKVNIHEVWGSRNEESVNEVKAEGEDETPAPQEKQYKEEEGYENISLFDLDDKM